MSTRNIYGDMSPHEIDILFTRAARAVIEQRETVLREYGLSSPEWFVLGHINHLWPECKVRVKEVAALLDVQSTYVTSVLRKLEQKEFIQLRVHPDDGRARIIEPTKRGMVVYNAVKNDMLATANASLNDVTDAAYRNYVQVLEALSRQQQT